MKGANNMPKKSSDAQIRASAKYNKENIKRVILHFNITTDKDILEHLSHKDNKTGYIKELIRDDIRKE